MRCFVSSLTIFFALTSWAAGGAVDDPEPAALDDVVPAVQVPHRVADKPPRTYTLQFSGD